MLSIQDEFHEYQGCKMCSALTLPITCFYSQISWSQLLISAKLRYIHFDSKVKLRKILKLILIRHPDKVSSCTHRSFDKMISKCKMIANLRRKTWLTKTRYFINEWWRILMGEIHKFQAAQQILVLRSEQGCAEYILELWSGFAFENSSFGPVLLKYHGSVLLANTCTKILVCAYFKILFFWITITVCDKNN